MEKLTVHDLDMLRVEQLKFIPYDNYTKSDIKLLEKVGIINGVGPEHYGWLFRAICTSLFSFLSYKVHDVNFWKGGDINDFHKANYGLLKYSYISMTQEYVKICNDKWYKKLYKIPLYYISLPIKSLCIHLAYNACERHGKPAFNFINK